MGNEGNGISEEVRGLVSHPLLIPSYPVGEATSESLNVGIATAIVLAEFRR
jgi:TrmH family RNA methyltransferase